MKRIIALVTLIMMCLSLYSCGGSVSTSDKNETTKEPEVTVKEEPDTVVKEVPAEEQHTSTENTTPTEPEMPEPEPIDTMISQFVALGFTDAEAEKMKEIFTTVGITEIYDIQPAAGSGIDKLQSFKCALYDTSVYKWGASALFTIDKRQLCFISINNFYNTTYQEYDSVTLYDKWDENGEIDNNSIGYKAVIDYENKKITAYE